MEKPDFSNTEGVYDDYFIVNDEIVIVPTEGMIIVKDGQEKIEPKLMNLLVFLMINKDRTVSREEIFSHIWADVVVTQNSLSQSVSRLRKVLSDDLKDPKVLKTVPRLGYKFIGNVVVVNREDGLPYDVKHRVKRRKLGWLITCCIATLLLLSTVLLFLYNNVLFPKKNEVIINPSPVSTKQGEIFYEPVSIAISSYLYEVLSEVFEGQPISIKIICQKREHLAVACEDQKKHETGGFFSNHYYEDTYIILPKIDYTGEEVTFSASVAENDFSKQFYKDGVSMRILGEELDDLLVRLTSILSAPNVRIKLLERAQNIVNLPYDPKTLRDRLYIAATSLAWESGYNKNLYKKFDYAISYCNSDCPLIYAAYGRVLLDGYVKTSNKNLLAQAKSMMLKSKIEYMKDIQLDLAVVLALSGNYSGSENIIDNIYQTSTPYLLRSLRYYLDRVYLHKDTSRPKKIRGALSLFLLNEADRLVSER